MAEEIPLFPLNVVLFPGMHLPLHIFEPRYREMIALCSEEKRPFGVILIREGDESGAPAVPFDIGTTARILNVDRMEDGRMNIVTVGEDRFRLTSYTAQKKAYMVGEIEPLNDEPVPGAELAAAAREVSQLAQRYVAMVQAASGHDLMPLQMGEDPARISFVVGGTLHIDNHQRQQILESTLIVQRLAMERAILEKEIAKIEEFLRLKKGGSLGPFSGN
jgi:Lon protease-like protein